MVVEGGKALCIKRRVSSIFRGSSHTSTSTPQQISKDFSRYIITTQQEQKQSTQSKSIFTNPF